MTARVRWDVNIRDVDSELQRLQGGLGAADITRLDATLLALFLQTQRDVHIDTESLKISGKQAPRHIGERWTGRITYGGRAPGAYHPVVHYAYHELHRGGQHDFMRSLEDTGRLHDDDFIDVLMEFLRGRGRVRLEVR